jgi:chromatin segregation and condensation protein Rec8/ScpA/Scc1 (kleisin family)
MKFLFLFISPIFSLKCSICKHFIEPNSNILLFGKCNLFTKTKDIYSINDKKETVKTKTIEDRSYCSTARQFKNMCGEEGKMFEKYLPEKNETSTIDVDIKLI